MAKLQQHKKQPQESSSRIKTTAVLETNETAQAAQEAQAATRRFRDGGIRDAQVADRHLL
jgi:hypothetical protein